MAPTASAFLPSAQMSHAVPSASPTAAPTRVPLVSASVRLEGVAYDDVAQEDLQAIFDVLTERFGAGTVSNLDLVSFGHDARMRARRLDHDVRVLFDVDLSPTASTASTPQEAVAEVRETLEAAVSDGSDAGLMARLNAGLVNVQVTSVADVVATDAHPPTTARPISRPARST